MLQHSINPNPVFPAQPATGAPPTVNYKDLAMAMMDLQLQGQREPTYTAAPLPVAAPQPEFNYLKLAKAMVSVKTDKRNKNRYDECIPIFDQSAHSVSSNDFSVIFENEFIDLNTCTSSNNFISKFTYESKSPFETITIEPPVHTAYYTPNLII